MYFRILGPLEAEIDGSVMRLTSAKQRTILTALLSAANDLVPLERLIDWCWPMQPPRSAIAIVQAHICRLRRALEPHRRARAAPSALVYRTPGYLLRVTSDQLDLLRFEELIAAGREALERDDPCRATDVLGQALALWRGMPMADVAHVDAAQATIARLEALRLSALVTRIDADLRLGRAVALVPELLALVQKHPYDERLCGQLMVALYRCGRQAEALEAYERLRVTLAKELDITPAPTSRRLREAIRVHHPDLQPPTWEPRMNGPSAAA